MLQHLDALVGNEASKTKPSDAGAPAGDATTTRASDAEPAAEPAAETAAETAAAAEAAPDSAAAKIEEG